MNTAALNTMQGTISRYIRSKAKAQSNDDRVRKGTIQGNRVMIDGHSYYYDPAVDIRFSDGDTVYCLLTSSGIAVIVGSE